MIQAFDVNVLAKRANNFPIFSTDPLTQVDFGDTYRYQLNGYDQDKDSYTFSIVSGPKGFILDSQTNVLTWDPLITDIGSHDVILRITDSYGDSSLQSFSITVNAANQPPVFFSIPPTKSTVGFLYQYKFKCLDPEGEAVTYSLKKGPPGNLTFEPTVGRFTFVPAFADIGTFPVVIEARDAQGVTSTQSYTLEISNNSPNNDPTLSSSPPLRVRLGDTWTYLMDAQDINGDLLNYTVLVGPSGMTVNSDGLFNWKPTSSNFGPNPVKLQVSDGRGTPLIQEFTIQVVSTNDNLPPKIDSTASLNAAVGKHHLIEHFSDRFAVGHVTAEADSDTAV